MPALRNPKELAMRVVATEDFRTYYRMVSVQVSEGQEFDGAFAEFLRNGRCPVEILDQETAGKASDPAGDLVVNGTAAEILDWVGDDPERARMALDAENEKDKPRSTLVKKLEEFAS